MSYKPPSGCMVKDLEYDTFMSAESVSFTVQDNSMVIPVRLWSPDGYPAQSRRPLIVVHDGSDYENRCHFTSYIADLIDQNVIEPCNVALLDPDDERSIHRLERYGASDEYRDLLQNVVLPTILERAPTDGPIIGVGASMGALALLHSADVFDSLFLQSASIHHSDYGDEDDYRKTYLEYPRVKQFVEAAREQLTSDHKLHINMTCGEEPNYRGNQALFYALRAQGHVLDGGPVAGGHDYESWGNAFEPHLRDLLIGVRSLRLVS